MRFLFRKACEVLTYNRSRKMEVSSLASVHQAIDKATRTDAFLQKELRQTGGFTLRRAKEHDDWKAMMAHGGVPSGHSYLEAKTPWHFGIQIRETESDELCGFLTFYIAYSTWNGRILYLDRLLCSKIDDAVEQLLLRTLAEIAVDLDYARLTWRHANTPPWQSKGSNVPEMHKEVITLSMDQQALENYVSGSHLSSGAVKPWTGKLTRTLVKSAINDCLSNINPSDPSNFRLRLATKADIETIGRMVQGLAEYVKEPDAVHLTVDDYRHDGFSDDDEPLYYCLLVDHVSDEGKVYTCGYAICFFGCILGEGRFLYLEDLFLEVEYRQRGGGNLVMQTLAQICQSLQCTHLYWQALDWNTSGLQFYDKIGAEILEGVMTSRYCGDAMKAFAEKETG